MALSDLIGLIRKALHLQDYNLAERYIYELLSVDPNNSIGLSNLSVVQYSKGCLHDARETLLKAIKADPYQYKIYNNLALLQLELGDSSQALQTISTALQNCGETATLRIVYGNIHFAMGNYQQAIRDYTQAIVLDSTYVEPYFNRYKCYLLLDQPEQALYDLNRALSFDKLNAEWLVLKLSLLINLEMIDEAISLCTLIERLPILDARLEKSLASCLLDLQLYDKAHSIFLKYLSDESTAEDLFNLGLSCSLLGDNTNAELYYSKAILKDPTFLKALVNYSNILVAKSQYEEAIDHLESAVDLYPTSFNVLAALANAYFVSGNTKMAYKYYTISVQEDKLFKEGFLRLGNIHLQDDDLKQALTAYEEALKIDCEYVEAWFNKGIIFSKVANYDESISCFLMANKLRPNANEVQLNLGHQYFLTGQLGLALDAYRSEVALFPDNIYGIAHMIHLELRMCIWERYNEHVSWLSNLDFANNQCISPWQMLSLSDDPDIELKVAKAYSVKYNLFLSDGLEKSSSKATHVSNRIKIGFFSSDFYEHATTFLIQDFFREIDKQKFDVFIYDYSKYQDEFTESLLNIGCIYRNILHLDNQSVVALARADHLDFAIDLKGFTADSRVSLFTARLATYHISFLGYPGTSGSNIYDYIIADNIIAPPRYHSYYTEKFILLDNSYQPPSAYRKVDTMHVDKEYYGLPSDMFVYCCFNSSYKIQPPEFDAWMHILSRTNSVLWLLRTSPTVEENLRSHACLYDVDPSRLIFTDMIPISAHLGRHAFADLQLDTFNVNAHTTAADSLISGLPILTKIGHTFSSRVCASILVAARLQSLVAHSIEEYIDIAVYLAHNPSEVSKYKHHLSACRESLPFFDINMYTRDFELKLTSLLL